MSEHTQTTTATAKVIDKTLYMIAWTGGYEEPSFATVLDEATAADFAQEWANDNSEEDGSRVEIILIQMFTDGTVATKKSSWVPEAKDDSDQDDDAEDVDSDEDEDDQQD